MNPTVDNNQLDYNILLLKHLDRMSAMVTWVGGEIFNSQGIAIHSKDADKYDAFEWSVRFLVGIIPQELKDKEYTSRVEAIWDEYRLNIEEDKKDSSNNTKLHLLKKYHALHRDSQLLKNCIDLLARRGYLYNEGGLMTLVNKNSISDDEEVWDD